MRSQGPRAERIPDKRTIQRAVAEAKSPSDESGRAQRLITNSPCVTACPHEHGIEGLKVACDSSGVIQLLDIKPSGSKCIFKTKAIAHAEQAEKSDKDAPLGGWLYGGRRATDENS